MAEASNGTRGGDLRSQAASLDVDENEESSEVNYLYFIILYAWNKTLQALLPP